MADSQFEVREIHTKEEYARLVEVLWAANFQPYNPVFTAVHPVNGHTEEDRARDKALDTEVRWTAHAKNPFSHLIYVIDKETGRVAGGCEWLIFHQNPFPSGPHPIPCTWYPEGSERAEYASKMISQAFFPRQCWFQRPHAGTCP
ncbi:GNAT family acetyltransferase [Penicillium hispanicum]|uniref:GNAT family acetyltransferase n=1 Tax=Penicillium hispanicum TaxID=1080232 RepID=UPI002540BCB1|nr:GNAT family acetyltransferase [Penicillium hispanicum]KAJ5578238.1 GNAT family acetyltransferase [Penicillium hispanicum]